MSETTTKHRTNRAPKKRGRPPKGWERVFLRALSQLPFVQPACRKARVGRSTAYARRQSSPKFAKAWDDALVGAIEDFEASCFSWARRGVKVPITFKGEITNHKLERSQFLAAIFLRGFNPDRYADPKQNMGKAESAIDVAKAIRDAMQEMLNSVSDPPIVASTESQEAPPATPEVSP